MLASVVGRTGYFGCLVLLGVVMLSVSCLAVFGATGAITAERGARVAPPPPQAEAAKPAEQSKPEAPAPTEAPKPEKPSGEATKPAAATPTGATAPVAATPPAAATKPAAQGTIPPQPPRVGPEGNIAQRLDREAIGGNLKV